MAYVLHRRPGLRLGLLLTPPMLWLGVAYLGALGALFLTAFWGQNAFTGEVERDWTLENFRTLLTEDIYRTITLRTVGVAILVTVVDALLAVPIAILAWFVNVIRFRGAVVRVDTERVWVGRRPRSRAGLRGSPSPARR